MADGKMDAEMVEDDEGCLLYVGVMAAASYFFPEIANYLQMLQSATDMYWNQPVFIISGNRF